MFSTTDAISPSTVPSFCELPRSTHDSASLAVHSCAKKQPVPVSALQSGGTTPVKLGVH